MNRRQAVTIEDVAREADVSRQTVSRVINNGPNVRDEVRDRVRSTIDRLGYVPNLSARRMGGNRSYLILAVNDRARTIENWRAGRGNDWVDQMLFGGMTACEAHGYRMIFELIDTRPDVAMRQLSEVTSSLRPDGVILTPPHSESAELVALLAERGIPCARVGATTGTATVDVAMGEAAAAEDATRHLIDLGHRRIAFLAGPPEYANSRLRLGGFEQAMRDAGLVVTGDAIGRGNFHFDDAAQVSEAMLTRAEPPSAIIAENDEMAFAALHVADRLGIGVPHQLSIISFEDTPGVRFSVPPLTAIRQPTAEMIGAACENLIRISKNEADYASHQLPYRLIVRATTGRWQP